MHPASTTQNPYFTRACGVDPSVAMIDAARARHSTTGTGTADDDDVVPATLIHFAISTTAFLLLGCCSPLIFNRIQSERQIHHSSTQEFAHTLPKPVYDIATADAALKDLIDNEMYRVKISEFAPLNSIVWLPVVYKQRNQHGSCQEGLKPGPGLGAHTQKPMLALPPLSPDRAKTRLGAAKWSGQKR
jgi:hypothetical protein